jgi:hypothetical protein
LASAAWGYSPDELPEFPEHHEVRRRLDRLVFAPVGDLFRVVPATLSQRQSSQRVRVRTELQNGFVYLLFLNEVNGRYPVFGQGSMVIRRDLSDGSFNQIKVFLRNDERFFVRIRPLSDDLQERAAMTVYAMGSVSHRDVVLPFSMETILTAPFSRVLEATDGIVRWSDLLRRIESHEYRDVRVMSERIRDALPSLPDAEDGAMDESGKLVFIESLRLQNGLPGFNCSGFAKWVCDGIYRSVTGRYMSIEALKEKHLDYRGHRFSRPEEDERDPYFGLDWSRNIATTMSELRLAPAGPESADVRSVSGFQYLEDVGYAVHDLGAVLYNLAVSEPGHFYIGSVNTQFGTAPVLRQHVHIAVFFPYFDEFGRFVVDVMERNVETSLESLEKRYPKDFVHLVRVRADSRFRPPKIE